MGTNVRKLLRKARNLIRKPENWIRYRLAATKDNRSTDYSSPHAAKFCVMGALGNVIGSYAWNDKNKLVNFLLEKNNLQNVGQLVEFNNRQASHDDIIQLFDNAINSCNSKKEI